jgi:hypothetical protein
MRDVFWSPDFTLINQYRDILEEAGIPAFIRDESSLAALQVLPSSFSQPALAVTNDEDYERARQILQELIRTQPREGPDWTCSNCGAAVPGNFDRCWHCGTARAS